MGLFSFFRKNDSRLTDAERRLMKKIVDFVGENDGASFEEISAKFKIAEPQVKHLLYQAVDDEIMGEYTMMGDRVVLKNAKKTAEQIEIQEETEKVIKCDGCGASFVAKGNIKECPYCGNLYK